MSVSTPQNRWHNKVMNARQSPVAVRVPASSANLGPGFDVLGLALNLHLEAGFGNAPAESIEADENHPLTVAFRHCGGKQDLWVRSQMPMGKGLGFSGAARVAGCILTHAEKMAQRKKISTKQNSKFCAVPANSKVTPTTRRRPCLVVL